MPKCKHKNGMLIELYIEPFIFIVVDRVVSPNGDAGEPDGTGDMTFKCRDCGLFVGFNLYKTTRNKSTPKWLRETIEAFFKKDDQRENEPTTVAEKRDRLMAMSAYRAGHSMGAVKYRSLPQLQSDEIHKLWTLWGFLA